MNSRPSFAQALAAALVCPMLTLGCLALALSGRARRPRARTQFRLRRTARAPRRAIGLSRGPVRLHRQGRVLAVLRFQSGRKLLLPHRAQRRGRSAPDLAAQCRRERLEGTAGNTLPPAARPGPSEFFARTGPRMGPEDAEIAGETGFAAVQPYPQLKARLAELAKKLSRNLYPRAARGRYRISARSRVVNLALRKPRPAWRSTTPPRPSE